MSEISIANGKLAFDLPDTWEDRSLYTFVAPERKIGGNLPTMSGTQGFHPNVVVGSFPADEGKTLEDFAKEQLDGAKRDLPGFTLKSNEPRTVGGQPALALTYTFAAPPSDTAVQCFQVLILVSGVFYTITCTTLPALFKEDQSGFDNILDSIQWR